VDDRLVDDASGSNSNPTVDDSSTENDESIEVEEEPEPVDEGLPEGIQIV
jgi:hypothetical protein